MPKINLQNRKGQRIVLQLDIAEPQKGLAFVLHGLGGFKEQPHVSAMADVFKAADFTVVNFDAANSIGESGGSMQEATLTNHYQDLEDVINWAKSQSWYREPFALAGHSLGATAAALYAEKNPFQVMALAPISAVVSGELSFEAHKKFKPEEFENWRQSGWLKKESSSKPGVFKRLPWSNMQDLLKYDLLPFSDKLTMPVLLIVGSKDISTPPEHQKIFYDQIPGEKELHIIEGSPHTFRQTDHIKEMKSYLKDWIKKIVDLD
jgi:pimeloyl-ACP methyl ester carboxylesterase